MSRTIPAKMLKAYFHVAEVAQEHSSIVSARRIFHRTKKVAFSVVAEKLDKDGLLPGETPYIVNEGTRRPK